MKLFISELKYYNKLFIGDFDSYTLIKYKYDKESLIFKTKVGLLLFDKLLLPAAFFWQSDVMSRVLPRVEPMIHNEYILPVIRDYEVTTDIKDYYERRMNETVQYQNLEIYKRPELSSEIARKENVREVNYLNQINTYVHLEETSVRDIFLKSWLEDLENYNDLNSVRMILFQSNTDMWIANEICKKLKNETAIVNFSRANIINHVLKMIPNGNMREKIENRISWLYLKANAKATDSSFYISNNPYQGLIMKENLDLLLKTLNVFGITNNMIKKLTFEELKRIKISYEYIAFISNYRELLGNIYEKQSDVVQEIIQRAENIILKEKAKRFMWENLKIINAVSASIFVGLIINYFSGSTTNNIVLNASGSTALISNVLTRIDIINKNMQKTSFSEFKKYIAGEVYKKEIKKYLEV